MFESVGQYLQGLGMNAGVASGTVFFLKAAFIAFLSLLGNAVVKKLIVRAVHSVIRRTGNQWDDVLLRRKIFEWLSHMAPAWIIYIGVAVLFPQRDALIEWIQRFAVAYMITMGFVVANALLSAGLEIYETFEVSRRRPIKGYVQMLKIGLWFFGGIFIIATLIDRSPWGLFSILGGLTAVLLLVFKDTILGFIASIQLIANNMLARGDWIEMPGFGADGEVIDISIHTVKVRNWDKTITTIPTYALMNNSFKNWEGMTRSGGRRIKRAIYVDMNTIRFCTPEMIERFKRIACLKDYIEQKERELREYNQRHGLDLTEVVNGRRMTNIGTFRAYVAAYLRQHPKIHQQMTFLVRHLAPTDRGLPLEIYVFSKDQVWANYEAIQADIFDHILAVIPEFGLRVFQMPSGYDVARVNLARQDTKGF